jgi:hypothetical protein
MGYRSLPLQHRLRVGFLLESLGVEDQRLADWSSTAQRGGSNRLFPGPTYGAWFSERLCLGINAELGAPSGCN